MSAEVPSQSNLLIDIQKDTFHRVLIAVYVIIWCALIMGNMFVEQIPRSIMMIGVGIMILCAFSLWLSHLHFSLACHSLIFGIWLAIALALHELEHPVVLYLFLVVILIASNLTRLFVQVLIAAGSSALILSIDSPAVENGHAYGSVLLLWIGLGTSYGIFRSLIQALDVSYHYQGYAVEQMKRAREQRAELARMAHALKSSQESMQRLNVQLRYARDAAEEARRLKAQFAANVSHELRTPINLIVGFSEVMATAPETYGVPLPSAYRADLQAIYRNAKHLQGLINDILDMSQIEAAQLAVVKEEADAGQVIEEAARMVRKQIENRGLQFCVEIPDHLPTIRMDRVRIRQVMLNLLANAARFTNEGSITLRAEFQEKQLVISVIDTGMGIPAEKQNRVFEEFYQIDSQLSRSKGGTGLGLALSRQFVTLHGGRIWVESEGIPGAGSTFSFTLPLTDSGYTVHQSPGAATADESARHGLLWNEDPAIVQLFRGYTRKHPVTAAHSLDQVQRLIPVVQPTAVICDQDTDTTALEAYLRDGNHAISIIKCPMPGSRTMVQALGLADFLVKPVSRQALLNALEQLGPSIEKVLIVDDERDILSMISRFLQTAPRDYAIRLAAGGQDGLQCIQQERPDAVILDIMMPDLDGFTVVQHLKADPALRHIPVIAVSAHGLTGPIAAVAQGDIVVRKQAGFQPMELVTCVEAIIQNLNFLTGTED